MTATTTDPLFLTRQPVGDDDLISQLRQMFIRARDARRPLHPQWEKNYNLIKLQQRSIISGRPFDSEIYPTLSALVAWMTDQSVQVDAYPIADPNSFQYQFIGNIANDLSAVLRSNWEIEDYDAAIKVALWDTFQFNTGILKSVWDASIANGYGNATIRRVDPWRYYIDPSATSLDDAEYCVEVLKYSAEELERRFPDSAKSVLKAGSGETDFSDELTRTPDGGSSRSKEASFNLGALPSGQQGQWAYSNSRQPFNQTEYTVYEYWVRQNRGLERIDNPTLPDAPSARPDKYMSDSWRCICLCNDTILFDEWASDLFTHGSHPYERYVFDDLGEFYGIAICDHLAQPQEYINRLLKSIHQNADLTGNPVLLEPQMGGTTRTRITNQPGQRIPLVGPAAMNNRPDWLKPPEMPQFVINLVTFWISRIENISGLTGIVKGQTPTARNAEGVIESIQEAAFVRVRSSLRNLEKTLERLAVKTMDLIVDNYTEPRIMSILGQNGQLTSIALRGRHFQAPTTKGAIPWKYALQLTAGSNFATSRQARIAEDTMLYTLGAIDDQALLQSRNYPHWDEVLQRKYQKMALGMAQAPGARQRSGRTS